MCLEYCIKQHFQLFLGGFPNGSYYIDSKYLFPKESKKIIKTPGRDIPPGESVLLLHLQWY
jgi:hypothetical protein